MALGGKNGLGVALGGTSAYEVNVGNPVPLGVALLFFIGKREIVKSVDFHKEH